MKHTTKRLAALLLAVVMVFGLLPATALAAPRRSSRTGEVTIDVTEYGADPTGTKESSTAVSDALEYAKTLDADTPKVISFPKGEYHFYADYSEDRELYVSNTISWGERSYARKYIGILVEDMKNVTIEGNGSQFIFHGNICTFAAIRSQNVVFQNFDMDHASPTVVDVTVESYVDEKAAILYVPPCYTYRITNGNSIAWEGERGPVTGQPYWTGTGNLNYQQGFNTITGQTTRNPGNRPFNNVSKIEQVDGDPTRLKVTYNNASNRPTLGMCFQMRNPNPRMTPGTFFWESDGVKVKGVNIQYLHGFGMVGQLSKNITLDTVKFEARPGTGRTSAGFADFVQMSSVGGEVTITNCEFSNPHDDPINIHGTFLEITEITADRRRAVVRYQHGETWGFPQYYPNDTVDFSVKSSMAPVRGEDGQPITRTVKSVVNPGEGLNLNGNARSKTNEVDMKTIIVEFNEPLPETITANDYVVENVTYTPAVQIDHCRFVETPTRGILCTTRQPVVIEDNYFDRMGQAAIYISCDASAWRESGRTEKVTIRRNTFVVNPHTEAQAAIYVNPSGNGTEGNRIHKNMLIENNVFHMDNTGGTQVNAIHANSVNGLTVQNNTILRYQPNVDLALSAANVNISAGDTQGTTLTKTGNVYSSSARALQFTDCENITVQNNIYDDGIFAGIGGNSSAQITSESSDVALTGTQVNPAVGAVTYFSSNPAVATVDASGVVTGVSEGTAEIYAFRTAAGRTFESNHLTFQVTGTAAAKPSKIEIAGGADAVEIGVASAPFTATVTPNTITGSIAWAVKPFTEGAAATIDQSGVLTATAPGVVEVTASLGGVTASKLVTVKKPNFDYLSDLEWTSATTGDGSWNNGQPAKDRSWESEKGNNGVRPIKLIGANGAELVFEKGIGTHAASEIVYDISGKGYTSFYAQAGVSYYQYNNSSNTPNLHFEVLGDNNSLKTCDSIYNAAAPEAFTVNIAGVSQLKLKVTSNKTGNGAFWGAHGNWADAKLYSNNQAPTDGSVALNALNDRVELAHHYNDADGDDERGTLFVWYVADTENGHYTRIGSDVDFDILPVTAAISKKWVKAVVVPRDATGRYGAPVTSSWAVQAPEAPTVESDATLSSLSVTGLTLTPAFTPYVTNYTVNVPAAVDSVTVNAAATQKDAAVAMAVGETAITDGSVTLDSATTTATVTVTAPDGETKQTYTITFNRARSSDATLTNLIAAAGSASISFNANTRFYELTAPQSAENLTFTATPADGATVKARFNTVEKDEITGPQSYPLTAGLNNLELRVTAEDGLSTALYRVRVLKSASNDAALATLTVNGEDVLAGMKDNETLARLTSNTAAIAAAANDPKASVFISVDGKSVASGGSVDLTEAMTTATVRVVAEDTATEQLYTVVLVKQNRASADLYSLKLGKLALSPAFDPSKTTYTATAYGNASVVLEALATQGDATVTYETVADYETADTGSVTGNCRFFKDVGVPEGGGNPVNRVTVTVTSPDGQTTKTYTVDVTVVESVYLSDLDWVVGRAGDGGWNNGVPGKDVSWESEKVAGDFRPIKLTGPNNEEATFEKGIGTHAQSVIQYDLSSMGFTTFTAKVGVSYYQRNSGNPNLYFEVECDGVNRYSSGDYGAGTNPMLGSTPYKEVSVNVEGVDELVLNVRQKNNGIGNAHGNWADAKLSSNIPLLANTTDVPIKRVNFAENETHTIYVNAGDDHTVTLTPTFKPDGVTQSAHQRVLEWESADENIATVVGDADNNGLVTAVGVGETTITATAVSGASDTCKIIVKRTLEGDVAISADGDGTVRLGSKLTANVNALAQEFKDAGLNYVWSVSDTANGEGTAIAGAEESQFTVPVEAAYKDKFITVTVTPKGTYHEGEAAATTAAVKKAVGPALQAVPTFENATDEDTEDGAITGLFKGRDYEWLKVENGTAPIPEDAVWTPFFEEGDDSGVTGNYGTARLENMGVGHYAIRRAADDLHEAGPHRTVTIAVQGTTDVEVRNPQTFEGGIVTMGRSQIPAGDTARLTVKPETGYELVSLKAITNTGEEIEADADPSTEGLYTFTMPNDITSVEISAVFTLKTYTITHDLEFITCNLEGDHTHTATHGDTPEIILKPDEGYEMPKAITMTNDDAGKAFTDFTYRTHATESAWRVVTFRNGVVCNVTVSGTAVPKTYTAVYHLTNGLTASGAPQTSTHGVEFTATLSAARGYALPDSITVEVGGAELTAEQYDYNDESGKVTIPGEQVTGNVVITAAGEAQAVRLQTVTLVGPARVGRTLQVNTVPVAAADTAAYQWIRVDADGNETVIEGETARTYEIQEEEVGATIKVKVTAAGSYEGEITSDPTATVSERADDLVFVTHIDLDPTEAEVKVGKTLRLTAVATPENATSKALFWASDNEAIATVDQNGVVTAVAEGSATITVSATDTIHTEAITYCRITVTKAETPERPSRPSGSNNSSTTTTTETRDDGSKVTTVTKPDGSVTETVQQPDGTKSETVTAKNGDVTITVTDPEGETIVKAEIPAAIPETETRFEDVPADHWADEAIHNAAALKLVNGVGNNKYDMVSPMTRGSLATVLHRLSQGKTDYETTFKDVAQGKYYTEGVAWAAKAKVVTGYTTDIFAPDDVITREQLAVMLARYAKLIGMDTKADSMALDQFADGDSTGDWAVDGVAWCVANGILKGKGQNDLDPTANVTRAEVAVMLDRFIALLK